MLDQHFTPLALAEQLLKLCQLRTVRTVVDFAAGDGALLKAAKERFPDALVYWSDIDKSRYKNIIKKNEWTANCCDFLNEQSVLWPGLKFDLIVLNPPFTCIGARREGVSLAGEKVFCSRALAFVITALDRLAPNGELLCVLPNGCLHSERDEMAWSLLHSIYVITKINVEGKFIFPNVVANISLVRMTPKAKGTLAVRTSRRLLPTLCRVKRGSIQMHKLTPWVAARGVAFIHSTSINNGKYVPACRVGHGYEKIVSGPALIFPRVGEPSFGKVAVVPPGKLVAMSDCVIAAECDDIAHCNALQAWIACNVDKYQSAYVGTGSRYTTLRRVENMLHLAERQIKGRKAQAHK